MIAPLSGKRLLVVTEDPELAGLITGVLSGLGGETATLASGRAALAALSRRPPDAAVLDLPLADLGAAPLLAAFARGRIPAVVISGVYRGPRAASELRRLGARDHLEKPFPLETLAAAVADALGATAEPTDEEARDEVTGSLPLQQEPPAIASPAFPALEAPAQPPAPTPAEGLAGPLPQVAATRATVPDVPPPPSGALASTSVPRLLVALHVGQATGALTLARGPAKKILVVERGSPVYAASNLAGERFGAICVRRGVASAERLDALRQAAPERRTADLLVGAGLLDVAALAELLAGQIRAITWSTFEWRDGTYRFQAGRPPAGRVPLKLEPGELILEGLRRTATLPRLQAELPAEAHLAPSPAAAFELYALRMLPEEARLLTLADGTKSVADLLRLTELPERDALAFLHACRMLRVLDEVARVLASTRRIGFM